MTKRTGSQAQASAIKAAIRRVRNRKAHTNRLAISLAQTSTTTISNCCNSSKVVMSRLSRTCSSRISSSLMRKTSMMKKMMSKKLISRMKSMTVVWRETVIKKKMTMRKRCSLMSTNSMITRSKCWLLTFRKSTKRILTHSSSKKKSFKNLLSKSRVDKD